MNIYSNMTSFKHFELLCYSESSQGVWVYIPCLFSISTEPISNARIVIKFREMLLTILARKQHDFIWRHTDPDVFWLRVRLLVEVEFVILSLSFDYMPNILPPAVARGKMKA
jgi:hypothetical protein